MAERRQAAGRRVWLCHWYVPTNRQGSGASCNVRQATAASAISFGGRHECRGWLTLNASMEVWRGRAAQSRVGASQPRPALGLPSLSFWRIKGIVVQLNAQGHEGWHHGISRQWLRPRI